jgi:hypothetical protein
MRWEEIPRIPVYPLPSYVRTPEQRERFELSHMIAELISAEHEPGPNSLFVLYMRETIYFQRHSDRHAGGLASLTSPPAARLV